MIKDIKYKLDSEIRERPSGQLQAAVLIGLLNYNHLRDNPEIIRRDHERRGISQEPINEVIRLDNEWKNSLHTMEASRRKRNIAAKEIAEAKKQGDQEKVNVILSQVKDLGLEIKNI